MDNYGQYHDLELYVFETVGRKFREQGSLCAFDFFCIVIWKANRAKSKVAQRIRESSNLTGGDLNERIRCLTKTVHNKQTRKDRLQYLMKDLGFRLPMASAVLTTLYPEEFTIYDERVCRELPNSGDHLRIVNKSDFEAIWRGYEDFKAAVQDEACNLTELRDKDRYLWGRSFYRQLQKDLKNEFETTK